MVIDAEMGHRNHATSVDWTGLRGEFGRHRANVPRLNLSASVDLAFSRHSDVVVVEQVCLSHAWLVVKRKCRLRRIPNANRLVSWRSSNQMRCRNVP